jgi:hypothetical protein
VSKSSSFKRGYEHGFEDFPEAMTFSDDREEYIRGYEQGQEERRKLKDDYSSNT